MPLPAATGGRAAITTPIYLDTSYSFAERAADLVSRMTLPEKASQAVSSQAPAIPRLGIPAYGWWNEALHGVSRESTAASGNAVNLTNTTSYPIDQSLGSSWDPELTYRVAREIGDEAREVVRSNSLDLDMYSPTMNLERDPRWGRNDESYGEDPLLVTKVVSQFVNGLEGKDQTGHLLPGANGYYKALATIKHYAANNSEVNRRSGSANMDDRTLREFYTAAFRGITQAAQPGSVMSSYNSVNGVPTAADPYLMDTLLRQTFGFQGYVTSDCDAVGGISSQHGTWRPPGWLRAPTAIEDLAFAMSAGEDLECNAGFTIPTTYRNSTPSAIGMNITTQTGLHTVNDLDTAVTRLFTARMELGEFDAAAHLVPWVEQARARVAQGTWVNSNTNAAVTETPARLALAREAADKSLVLLKNSAKTRKDGTSGKLLPIQVPATGAFKVLVTGFYGNNANFYLGGYSSTQAAAGQAKEVTPYAGIKAAIQAINPAAVVDFQRGFTGTGTNAGNCCAAVDPAAVAAAPGYDDVIVYAGMDSTASAGTTGTEDRDRTALTLPGVQGSLINQIAAANPNTIAVMETIGPQEITSFEPNVGALIWSSYNGERKGEALADVLLGAYNPSGHLPSMWYQNVGQIPLVTDYAIRPVGPTGRTYMYYNGPVSYPFGWGLSYTDFSYSNLHIDQANVDANDTFNVSVDVTNSGAVAGNEVVQLYVTTPDAPADLQRPIKRLEGFQKVFLSAGETKTVTLAVKVRALAFFDQTLGKYVVDPGRYGIQVSKSSADADIQLQDVITASGTLNAVPSVVSVKPTMQGDAARDVSARVMFPEGVVLVPNTTVSTIDDSLYGFIQKGVSKPFPSGMSVGYTSNRPGVVSVDGSGVIHTVGNGVATITATATAGGVSKSADFTVRVISGLNGLAVNGRALKGFAPDTYSYDVIVPDAIAAAPALSASAANPDATVTITQATSVPGTATILVTGPDGLPFTYTVNFARPARSDEFDGDTLGPQWSWVRQNAAKESLGGGSMTITAESGDLQTTTNTAKNLLLQSAFGDWTIETKAVFSVTPHVANQQGGIIAYQDDNNYLRFGWEFSTNARLALTLEDSLAATTPINQILTTLPTAPASRTVWLRMSRAGSIYTTSYSTDGTTFTPLWSNGATLTNVKAGLFAFNRAGTSTDLSVAFDYFHIATPAAVLPVTTATIAPPSVNGAYRDNSTVTLDAADSSGWGIASTQFSLDGDPFEPYTSPFSVAGDGAHTLDYFSTDGAGNVEATKTLAFSIDAMPPVLTTSANVVAEATGPTGAVVTYPDATANDLVDGPAAARCLPASGSTFALHTTTVACTATDQHGNTGTATFDVLVRDTTAPTVSVPADRTVEATGPSGAIVTYDAATSTDIVDGTDPVGCLPASGSAFPFGVTHVACTAVDSAGNVGVKTFAVTVADTTPPALTAMDDVTVEATSAAGAIVTFLNPTAFDIVDGPLDVGCAPASGSLFPRGRTEVLCTATDSAGNIGTRSFNVYVPHTSAPVVTVPDNIVVEATGPSGAVASFTASASDIVDGPLTPSCTPGSGSTFPVGDSTVTCSVTDSDRLTGTATFHVLVTDTTPPSVHVPANVVAEATGPGGRIVTFTSDASDIVDVTDATTCTPRSGSTFVLGHTQVTCKATDAAGNEGASYFDVNIVDTTPPAIVPHANIVANATETGGAHVSFSLSASDLVDGSVAVTCAPASGSLFAPGHTTVHCSSTDAHHNTSTSSFDVYVKTAALQLQELSSLIDSFTLKKGKDKKFENTLANSAKHLARGQLTQVCKELDDLIKKAGKESGKSLTPAESDALVAAATRIQGALGC